MRGWRRATRRNDVTRQVVGVIPLAWTVQPGHLALDPASPKPPVEQCCAGRSVRLTARLADRVAAPRDRRRYLAHGACTQPTAAVSTHPHRHRRAAEERHSPACGTCAACAAPSSRMRVTGRQSPSGLLSGWATDPDEMSRALDAARAAAGVSHRRNAASTPPPRPDNLPRAPG
jgi:hypothetical protein